MSATAKRELPLVYLARHGETEWSVNGKHTGLTDIPLTERGERGAALLVNRFQGIHFSHVFTSPLIRAKNTARLAGFPHAEVEAELVEWDYGEVEGITTAEYRKRQPEWNLFRDGSPGGESIVQISDRADRVIARLRKKEGNVLLFSHGHFSRVLAARWVGLDAKSAAVLFLTTAAVSILGYEHTIERPAIRLWNDSGHLDSKMD